MRNKSSNKEMMKTRSNRNAELEHWQRNRRAKLERWRRKNISKQKAELERWRKKTKNDPSDVKVLENLSRLAFRLSQPKKALSYAERALDLFPLSTEALLWKGYAYLVMNKCKQAEQTFKTAISINPYEKLLYKALSIAYGFIGNRRKQRAVLHKVFKMFPDDRECAEWLVMNWLSHSSMRTAL